MCFKAGAAGSWAQTLAFLLLLATHSFALRTLESRQDKVCDLSEKNLHSYKVHKIKIPIDHFHNDSRYAPHSDGFFENRYWFDDRYYEPGGPVIITNGGEGNGEYYIPDMEVGLPHILAKATKGLSVLFEHRYYGDSWPVNQTNTNGSWSREGFRFLSTEQAMADQAYFAQNVKFAGKEHLNLTAPNTPWFAMGCSYPGGLTAFERIQYPDLFWVGEPVRFCIDRGVNSTAGSDFIQWRDCSQGCTLGPQDCVDPFSKALHIADNILLGGNATQIKQLKHVFGFNATTSNVDFAATLNFQYTLQGKSWVSCLDYSNPLFCQTMSNSTLQYQNVSQYEPAVKEIIANGGYGNEIKSLTVPFLNFIGVSNDNPDFNPSGAGAGQVERRESDTAASVDRKGMSAAAVLNFPSAFLWQMCTELGWFKPDGGPQTPLPIVSKLVTLKYLLEPCKQYWGLTSPPNTKPLSRYGTYNVAYPRLMIVGGEADPWRPATPLAAQSTPTRLNTTSTPDQPWVLIKGATHCWDWDGLFKNETHPGIPPEAIKEAHAAQISAFQRWLKEWHDANPHYQVASIE